MKYRLICSDLDDTLINREGNLCPGTKQAIADYEKRGGVFCIVTGRMTSGAVPLCKELGLKNELATFQGAVISSPTTGEVYYKNSIPCEKAVEIGKFIEENGFYYQTYDGDKFYTATPNDFTRLYGRLSHADFVATDKKLSDFIYENKINPPKILLMEQPEKIPGIMQILRDKFGKEFLINTSKPFIIEIIPHGINKGLAVEFMAKRHGIKREEIICIGDSENDLTMIEYAGLGVCVASGSSVAKEKADVIAPSCNDDPIKWLIDTYCK